ncbi:hypothetical protein ACFV4N_17935, partial [Actinosynnema sp. NPDC059797]
MLPLAHLRLPAQAVAVLRRDVQADVGGPREDVLPRVASGSPSAAARACTAPSSSGWHRALTARARRMTASAATASGAACPT